MKTYKVTGAMTRKEIVFRYKISGSGTERNIDNIPIKPYFGYIKNAKL